MSLTATVDQVRTEARLRAAQVDPARALATLLLFPFIVAGWIVGKVFVLCAYGYGFVAAAWRVGYRQARGVNV